MIKLKRAYEKPEASDGIRILVDRLWPRGIKKEVAKIDEWFKGLAPSDELRRWFGHKPERWEEFKRLYTLELRMKERQGLLKKIKQYAKRRTVTLLFGAKDAEHNNAIVLKKILEKME